MTRITATELARNLSDVLDAVEHRRESFEVVRNGQPVARVTPSAVPNGARFKAALKGLKPDPDWWEEILRVRSLLTERDPWRD